VGVEEAVGVLDLAVGELVGAGVPVDVDAEAAPVGFVEGGEGLVDAGQVGGAAVGGGGGHADEQGSHRQLSGPAA